MRYLLAREDEDGVERFWGKAAGVEGLFVDPVPPRREIITLLGCRPDGPLKDALFSDDVSAQRPGEVCVEVWDDERPVQWWTLLDAVVIARQPHPGDATRYDIVLGAGVQHEESFLQLPAAPRFELFAGTTAAAGGAGECLAVDGLFKQRPAPAPVALELVGCEPAEPLLAVLRRPRAWERDWAHLLVLDRHGAVMASHVVGLAIAGARPSVLGGALVDITLANGGDDRPLPAIRPVWDQWYQGPPTEPNLWAPYDAAGRLEWIGLTTRAFRLPAPKPDRSGGRHHLDGRFVTDIPGLHCAVAEALLGPGHYFGREWNAFKDCLGGGFGVAPPFTLIWHDSEVARRALAEEIDGPTSDISYFEDIVQLLRRCGATVVLQ
ncbi:barstar family protein [Actinomadura terrae]|uniref:barstar family protein n=1 Tax=Actinomadura terrae TaxID=604353 RepID=UPI001FA7741B|nr:barstar family protein [Actinomadura terrae]